MSPRSLLLALAAPLLLTACSSGPSEDDITQAVQAQMAGLPSFAAGLVKQVKKISCDKGGEGWMCDVSVTLNILGEERTDVQRLRFIKTDKGWAVSR